MRTVSTVWKEKRIIESFDVDILGRLRPQALLAFLLNSAWNHANGSVYGYRELSARNLMWVLVKLHMIIRRQPRWGEELEIETWGKGIERIYALRDFTGTSSSGERIVSATSSWLIVDRTSGRPRRFNPKGDGFPWEMDREEMKTDLEKVQKLDQGRQAASFRVHFSDIDVNGHVNSARYLQWMIDSHSQKYLEEKEMKAVEISFLSEAMANDEIAVYSEGSAERELCSVRRAADKKDLCRARFEWEDRES